MGEIAKLQQIIDESKNIVFFGGAGLSAGSNFKPYFFPEKAGRILSVLSGKNAVRHSKAKCSS